MPNEPTESPAAGSPQVVPSPVTNVPLAKVPPLEPQPDPDNSEPATSPAWANDLRQLYNAVVEEPLPDSFIDLLSQLDAED